MNIWLNPKYSNTMGVHAGKPLSQVFDMGNLQRLSLKWEYTQASGSALPLTQICEGEEIV